MTKDTRERFTFRMPEELKNKITEEASKKGISVNALILQILWAWIQEEERKER